MDDKLETKQVRGRPKNVVFIHGINSDGNWQHDLVDVFKPFFKPVPVFYDHYRCCGVTKLFIEPYVVLAGIIIIMLLVNLNALQLFDMWFWVTAAVVIVIAVSATHLRKRFALNAVKKQVGDFFRDPPNYVAHSFGTYLIGLMLKSTDSAKANRIVLTGSVLDNKWNWHKISELTGLVGVRNEHSAKDWVARLAKIVGLLVHDGMGSSGGKTGFSSRYNNVHNIDSPNISCEECLSSGQALVHNVKCPTLNHNDKFHVRSHAILYWLPYFWNIDPVEYSELLRECRNYFEAYDRLDDESIKLQEKYFRDHEWGWLNGESVFEKALNLYKEKNQGRNSVSELLMATKITYIFCMSIVYATRDDFSGDDFRMLYPWSALRSAVSAVLDE